MLAVLARLPPSNASLPPHPHPGDGTVLWTCHIFGNQSVPPVVPFNLGSLGFLTPFDPGHVASVLQHVMEGEGERARAGGGVNTSPN